MTILGQVVDGVALLSDVEHTAQGLSTYFGGSWFNLCLEKGFCATHLDADGDPDEWSAGPYLLQAQCGDGRSVVLDVQQDPSGLLYRGDSPYAIGSGKGSMCAGCTNCIPKYDLNLHVIGCTCISDGSCSIGTVSV